MKALVLVLSVLAAAPAFAATKGVQTNKHRTPCECKEGDRKVVLGYMDSTMEAPQDVTFFCRNGKWAR